VSDNKYSFIVVKYPDKTTGDLALAAIVALSKEKLIKLKDAVAITKSPNGKIKLHQTKDDAAGKGLLKGGAIGVLFALLLGPAGWIVAGAALGTAFAMFDRGIKNKLLKELGDNMTSDQSALAVLVEHADWETVIARMREHNFMGTVVVSELVPEDAAVLEKYVDAPAEAPAPVPEELEVEPAAVTEGVNDADPVEGSVESAEQPAELVAEPTQPTEESAVADATEAEVAQTGTEPVAAEETARPDVPVPPEGTPPSDDPAPTEGETKPQA
jgi:uncharacterized membrane protein